MSITILVAGSSVPIIVDSCTITDNEASASTAQFVIYDSAGTGTYTQNMVVSITDSVNGLQFAGYIDSAQPDLLNPGPALKWTIICKDKSYLASKREVIQPDFPGTLAGDMVTDIHAKYLAAEGVLANYALDHDTNAATFGLGTLVSTTAVSGDLELTKAGSIYTKKETSTADFATGTLTGVAAANNALTLTPTPTIKYSGSVASNVTTSAYCFYIIWNGSITINTNDQLIYDLFINSNSPQMTCTIDLMFSDGTYLRTSGSIADQFGNSCDPTTDLTGYADDQWNHRIFQLTNNNIDLTGKTIIQALMAFGGQTSGTYTAYFQNVTLQSSGFVVRQTFFSTTLQMSSWGGGDHGYYNVSAKVVTGYAASGNRISPSYSVSAPGIANETRIGWTTPTYVQQSGTKTYPVPLLIESSYDGGATWQTCTSGQALPNLPSGLSLGSITVTLRETLSLAGPDPTLTPQLSDLTFSISPSYAATKSDAVDIDRTSGDFATGTITNTGYSGGLIIQGIYWSWKSGNVGSLTIYATPTSGPVASVTAGQLNLRSGMSGGCLMIARLDFAGTWADFVAEYDFVHLGPAVACQYGFQYRTTGWQINDGTFAYLALATPSAMFLYRGTNSSGGATTAYTQLGTFGVTWVANASYHVKLVVVGSSHKIYVNGLLMITVTDGTYTAAGNIGFRILNGTNSRQSASFNTLGIQSPAFQATRVHPALSISATVSVQTSLIQWNAITPSNVTLLVESSIDGGSTYQTCTNNAVIPQLTPGVSTSGKSLLIRETLTTQNANATPVLQGIAVIVVGKYTATGTRVSPALSIGPVGRVGSSSITWTANTPTGTTLLVEESLVSATGAWTTATNGGVIPTITSQPVSVSDGFTVSTAGNYTNTNYAGVNATWTFDVANSRLTALNGTNGVYVWNQINAKDMQIDALLNQAATAGLIWRYTNVSNFYLAVIADASSGTNPNTIKLYKRVAGVTSGVLATGAITFTRGTYHTLRIAMSATTITAYFDGVSVTSVVDAGLAGPGSVGFMQSSTTQTNWYSIRGQQFGDDVTGKSVWTRCTLTSTDPTLTPAVTDLVTSVRGQQLQSGIVIGQQAYQYQQTAAGALDDITKKCPGYTWGITDAGVLTFQHHLTTPADWPLATVNSSLINGQQLGDIQWSTPPVLKRYSPLYRNRSIIVGGMDITTLLTAERIGDNFTQAWPLAYPVAFAPIILLNGQPVNTGVRGVDTGMDFYYVVGDPAISQELTATPLAGTDVLTISYYGQIPVVKQSDNIAQQTALATLEGGTSGIVEVVETINGLNAVAAQAMADSRVAQYAILSQDFTFTTLRSGLRAGQLLQCFVPQYPGMTDILALVTQVTQVIKQGGSNASTLTFYTVTCTTGPNVGSWTQLFIVP